MSVSPPPEELWTAVRVDCPVAMLPVRLETRFGTRDAGAVPVLRVRIFPDELSVVRPTLRLSDAELAAGRHYHAVRSDAALDDHARAGAWEVLCQRVGAGRADFVGRATQAAGAAAEPAPLPPVARLLPDSWVVVGEVGETAVFAHHVERRRGDLQMGPTREADAFGGAAADVFGGQDALRWLTDFDRALEIGMAAEIDLVGDAAPATGGLSALYVVGLREADPEADTALFAELLASHAATDRLGFVPVGTATNTLTDTVSGWSSTTDVHAAEARVGAVAGEHWTDGTSPLAGGGDSGAVLAAAMGFAADASLVIEGSSGRDQWLARQMAEALFPVTLGEVVGTLSRPTLGAGRPPTGAVADRYVETVSSYLPFARAHVASYVRARGPLPTLRVGRQPYGALPVMPTRDTCRCGATRAACGHAAARCCPRCVHWVALGEEASALGDVLHVTELLRPFWEAAAAGVPRLRRGAGQALDLARALLLGPVPHTGAYRVTDVVGPVPMLQTMVAQPPSAAAAPGGGDRFDQIATRLGADDAFVQAMQALAGRRLLSEVVTPLWGTQLEDLSLAGEHALRVDVAATRPERHLPAPADYLAYLARDRTTFRLAATPPDPPTDLLYVLLEYAVSLGAEQDEQVLAAAAAREQFLTASAVPRDLVDTAYTSAMLVEQLYTTGLAATSPAAAAAGFGEVTFGELVLDTALMTQFQERLELAVPVGAFSATRAAIRHLADARLSDEQYARLTSETLSTVSTRLDAWITSMATARLDTMRQRLPLGTQFGAWGVLVDVVPQTAPDETDLDRTAWLAHLEVPAGTDVPLRAPLDRVGFVHAPSLAQAVTAGVLRAGEVAHRGDDTSLASLDLTSGRMRLAREVLAGMRNGQPLGALLGYRLERLLHDAGDHTTVAALRERYPQRRHSGAEGTPAGSDDVVPPEVVDGYEVWRYRDTLGVAVPADVLAQLDRMVEAVADLLVAEGVHQVTTSRPEAAGATFDAVAYGSPPPEPTVLDEPRAGSTVTHRVLVADDGVGTAGWNDGAPRALLAPTAERWAQGVLGAASTWTLMAHGQAVALDVLGICALDVLAETRGAGATAHTGVPALSGVATSASGLPFDDRLLAAAGGHAADLGEDPDRLLLYALAGAAYDVLAGARPLLPKDVQHTGGGATRDDVVVPAPGGPDAADVAAVTAAVSAQLRTVQDAVAALTALTDVEPPPGQVDSRLLEPLAALGVPGCLALGGTVPAAVAAAAASAGLQLLADVDRVIDARRPSAAGDETVPLTAENRLDHLATVASLDRGLDTLTTLARRLGGDAVVPCVPVDSHLGDHRVTGAEAGSAPRWLARTSRVSPAVAAFEDLLVAREARGHAVDLELFQLPWRPEEGWLGGQLSASGDEDRNPLHRHRRPSGPRTHLLASGSPGVLAAPRLTGLVVAELSEVLPAETVTTGVALHYDAPSARPPQAMLLAVHPNVQSSWHWELAVDCAREALTLATMRGVDLDDLAPLGLDQYLPLTYVVERDGATPLDALWKLSALEASMIQKSAIRDANRYALREP